MNITKQQITHIRTVEASLLGSQKVDRSNSYHNIKMLNKVACLSALNDCVLSKYCKSIYTRFIYPIYMYLEYTNNFLTYESFAEHMKISVDKAKRIVNTGASILETINRKG